MKTVLITGVSGTIGKAIAKKYLSEGYFVLGQYNKNIRSIDNFVAELEELNLKESFYPICADFSTADGVEELVSRVYQNFNHVDVLVNNAGVDLIKLLQDTEEEEYDEVMNVNLKSSVLLTKAMVNPMIERKQGKIIFISSIWGVQGASMESVYSASKFALIGLTKSLAKELGYNNITVNAVCPGVIDSPMNDVFTEEEKTDLIERTPLSRLGKPEEVAELVYFLTSEKAEFINGQAIVVDGGFAL